MLCLYDLYYTEKEMEILKVVISNEKKGKKKKSLKKMATYYTALFL